MLLGNMPKFPLIELSCLIFFLVPMLCIAVLYVKMGLRIQSNGLDCTIEGSVHGETRQTQSRKAIIRMLGKFFFPRCATHNLRMWYTHASPIRFVAWRRTATAFYFERVPFLHFSRARETFYSASLCSINHTGWSYASLCRFVSPVLFITESGCWRVN